ncbi:hypothetical protein GIB67_037170 [Kingdonia uniflora]|uniref:MATH domain-containing protein n=1 Tax=Kingdonia uniflora TaxID=39325 RepID=A0A7J7MRZ6_9MAGN|nr:hypothetical protein GIB67_037170 [Kingdonia uniflora]
MEGIQRSTRQAPPTHLRLKIESFSLIQKTSLERYDSLKFEAGGYKWKLAIYPNGNKCGNGIDHISFYLVLVDKSSFGINKEAVVTFNLFLFDQFPDKYFGYLVNDICVLEAEVFFIKNIERGNLSDGNLSVYLVWADSEISPKAKVLMDFKLRLVDQLSGKHKDEQFTHWFDKTDKDWGWGKFLLLSVPNLLNEFLVKDCCKLEAEVTILGDVKNLD